MYNKSLEMNFVLDLLCAHKKKLSKNYHVFFSR